MLRDNTLVIKDDITKAIDFAGDIQGTTTKLIDASIIGSQKCLNRYFTKAKTKTRSVHEMIWEHDKDT